MLDGAGHVIGDDQDNNKYCPFRIVPTQFEIGSGEDLTFAIQFSPREKHLYSHMFKLLSENGEQIYNIQGAGAVPCLAITSINGTPAEQATSTAAISFTETTPKASLKKKLSITNCSEVPIHFHWEVHGMERPASDTAGLAVSDSIYSIEPTKGAFQEDQTIEFTVLFHPQAIGTFQNMARYPSCSFVMTCQSLIYIDGCELQAGSRWCAKTVGFESRAFRAYSRSSQ
jgi:hypothetical protein